MEYDEIGRFLHELCDVAQKETLPRFRSSLRVHNKADQGFDPVTEADRAAERAIRETITSRYPTHAIIGEEEQGTGGSDEYCWIVDPIDGTRSFIAGLPSWGTLIGLAHAQKSIAGIMHQPFTGERYVTTGDGAFLQHGDTQRRLKTSEITRLADATMLTTSPFLFAGGRHARYCEVARQCRLVRFGFDCYGYAMVAGGWADLVVESGLNIFDIAALIPLIEQAGGVVTTWNGENALAGGDIVAAANPELHSQVVAILSRD